MYAAVGSFVSRPDDLQTLSLPLSLLAMVGYLGALPILLTGGAGTVARLMSLLPPFSPFAMLARLMVGQVPPWEVALSLGLLVLAIAAVAVGGDPDLFRGRAAVRAAPGPARVRGRRDAPLARSRHYDA